MHEMGRLKLGCIIMDITFKKKRDDLVSDVISKSMDIEHERDDLNAEIENCSMGQKFMTISPACIKCNLCAEECPVNAVDRCQINKIC